MGTIVGLEGMNGEDLARELDRGGRFVVFEYAISLVLITFKRSSDVRFIRGGEGTFLASLPYTLLTMLLGWWGFPWGPIYSGMAIGQNLTGGRDVTDEVLSALRDG